MSDQNATQMTYFGGPKDGEAVTFEPGRAPPDRMLHHDWTGGGYYVRVPEANRYEWRTGDPHV